MTDAAIDLDAYFARIGHEGPRDASLATLAALQLKHPQAIAFENLDPFLGHPVDLDPKAVEQKLVKSRRGGSCFEQNLVFLKVLRALGFSVTPLAARVLWGRPSDVMTPRSHMLLLVTVEAKPFIADVGFGGLTQTAPLLLSVGSEQPTPHETFRIVQADEHFRIEANTGGEWRGLYRFDLARQYEVDYVAANWFLSTNQASPFVTSLMAARPLPDRRYALSNGRLSTHHTGGPSEQKQLSTPAEIAGAIEELFEIEIPDAAAFELAMRAKNILEA
jgi:N-hydroxyarylamine O-acetyltransferase